MRDVCSPRKCFIRCYRVCQFLEIPAAITFTRFLDTEYPVVKTGDRHLYRFDGTTFRVFEAKAFESSLEMARRYPMLIKFRSLD